MINHNFFVAFSALCWLGDRKVIQPVKNPDFINPEVSPLEAFHKPGINWSTIWKKIAQLNKNRKS